MEVEEERGKEGGNCEMGVREGGMRVGEGRMGVGGVGEKVGWGLGKTKPCRAHLCHFYLKKLRKVNDYTITLTLKK